MSSSSTITSLGVASGLDLESIVNALVSAKKSTKTDSITKKQAIKELEVTGLSTLKSTLTSFQDSLKKVIEDDDANKRKVVTNLDNDNPAFSYELKGNATNSSHEVAVTQLAYGTKLLANLPADAAFKDTDADGNETYRLNQGGTISFTVGSGDDEETFSVDISKNDSLETVMKKINESDENPGVYLNYVVDASGSINFILESSTTGDGKDLRLSGDTSVLGFTGDGSSNEIQKAQNAIMNVDGLTVTSSTNTFDGQISGLKLTASELSEKDEDGNFKTNRISVETDNSSFKSYVQSFVSSFNSILSKCDELFKSNTYTNGKCNYDGGDLAGDSICTNVKNALKSVITDYESSSGKTLYQVGVSISKDGTLSVDSDKLGKAIEGNYDQFLSMFNEVCEQLNDKVDVYTKSRTGIIAQRSDSASQAVSDYGDRLTSINEYLEKYEETLRKKYTNLDTMISNMNSSLSYIQSIMG